MGVRCYRLPDEAFREAALPDKAAIFRLSAVTNRAQWVRARQSSLNLVPER